MAFETAWKGEYPKSCQLHKQIRLFKSTWENPAPELETQTVDFVAVSQGPCSFLVAMTAEQDPD